MASMFRLKVDATLAVPVFFGNDMFEALHGRCESWFLELEGMARELLLTSFNFWFLFGLGRRQRLRGSNPIPVGR